MHLFFVSGCRIFMYTGNVVYIMTPAEQKKWETIKLKILTRDHNRCIICFSTAFEEYLTAHHIISRERGGDDQDSNLVTLCNYCHDGVEIEDFDNYDNFWKYVREQRNDLMFIGNEPTEYAGWDDFHLWVYGGYKNPNNIKIKNQFKKRENK